MSVVGVHRLVRDLERRDGLVDRLLEQPAAVLETYPLSDDEREAVLNLDAAALVDLGVNPLVMRTLLVLAGVANPDIYSHTLSLRS
ncbi:hypothetical protein E4J89_17410 [Arthrobacter sp. CAU 1506]|uniref:hypothetical protein n=1 Tax=Arthrobacter sp. CAU 1506 TaxID=2560052 RepID=UPI0010AD3282|nr:hypothetical protein [Arthrobacter sp. CAU 1506]TJY66157.1 hypothetical protein E4J89_17410 [Arthrobacter sp. CAU 1506]